MKNEICMTKFVEDALRLSDLVLRSDNPIGEIVGATGTGKSTVARYIAEEYGGVRVACWDGINKVQLLKQIAAGFGMEGAAIHTRLLTDGVPEKFKNVRPLLVVDEANKLNWRALETLRFLSDERDVAVLLVGTEFYERQFTNNRTADLLLQLGRRIGSKRVRMENLDLWECYTCVGQKYFGDLKKGNESKKLITKFWHGCRKGVWGDAVELAKECQRLMKVQNDVSLTEEVLDLALSVFANRHAAQKHNGGDF